MGEEYRRLPCLHIFHTAHIDEWLYRKEQCPLCNHRCAWTRHDPPTSVAGRRSDEWEQLRGDRLDRVLDRRLRRLRNEWEQLRADRCEVDGVLMQSCNVCTTPDVKMHLSVNLAGPEGSPYHGQVFVLDVQLCKDFPYRPPRFRFDTPILHPNVSPWTGELAIGEEWNPTWSVYEVLLAVRRLLAEPDAESAVNHEAAEMYLHRREQFLRTVRAWADPGAEADESRLLAAAMVETPAGDLASLGQAADVLESALGAVGSGSTLSVSDAAAILNELALQCPRLEGLLQAHEWDGCQLNQQRLLVPMHTALALELGRETPDSLGVGGGLRFGPQRGEDHEVRLVVGTS